MLFNIWTVLFGVYSDTHTHTHTHTHIYIYFYLFVLFQVQGVKTQVFHPCYPQDFNTSIKLGEDVFDSPCTKRHRPAKFNSQMSVSVVGTGDYHECLGNVTKMFSFDNCSFSRCSFDGVFQPSVRGNFMVREPRSQIPSQLIAEGASSRKNTEKFLTHRLKNFTFL